MPLINTCLNEPISLSGASFAAVYQGYNHPAQPRPSTNVMRPYISRSAAHLLNAIYKTISTKGPGDRTAGPPGGMDDIARSPATTRRLMSVVMARAPEAQCESRGDVTAGCELADGGGGGRGG